MATLKLVSLSIVAASTLAISTPAMADLKHRMVQYGDLDLSSVAGQEQFKTRVRSAVKAVCGSPRAITLNERIDKNRCEDEAMASAMPKAERAIAQYQENKRLAARDPSPIVGGN